MNSKIVSFHGIKVSLTVKAVRRMSLRVNSREPFVHLTVPYGADGESVVAFMADKRDWIVRSLRAMGERLERERAMAVADRGTIEAWGRGAALRLDYWSGVMGLGYDRLVFMDMSSRWGSCRPARRAITLNTRLRMYPRSCLDYVCVHELAHLVHANHSADFWALVGRYCPDYRHQRDLLKGPGCGADCKPDNV